MAHLISYQNNFIFPCSCTCPVPGGVQSCGLPGGVFNVIVIGIGFQIYQAHIFYYAEAPFQHISKRLDCRSYFITRLSCRAGVDAPLLQQLLQITTKYLKNHWGSRRRLHLAPFVFIVVFDSALIYIVQPITGGKAPPDDKSEVFGDLSSALDEHCPSASWCLTQTSHCSN